MAVLRRAASLSDSQDNSGIESPTVEKEAIIPTTPMTPRSILFSSDEEYRTASEGNLRPICKLELTKNLLIIKK